MNEIILHNVLPCINYKATYLIIKLKFGSFLKWKTDRYAKLQWKRSCANGKLRLHPCILQINLFQFSRSMHAPYPISELALVSRALEWSRPTVKLISKCAWRRPTLHAVSASHQWWCITLYENFLISIVDQLSQTLSTYPGSRDVTVRLKCTL